jgi:transcriptional regulator with XRE-family HTH domain
MAKHNNSPIMETLKVSQNTEVGRRLREVRMGKGYSIRSLADKSKLNVNTLSLIENGHTSPSVSTLQVIAQTLQVPITTFFESYEEQKVIHQCAGERSYASFEHGKMENLGAGINRFGAEPLIITLDPHADSGKTSIVHTGSEFVYCLDGHITYLVDDRYYSLANGDSLMFEAHLPHRWQNDDSTPSRMLLVLCPLDERDQPTERHFGR